MIGRRLAVIVGVGLASSACLIEPNPDFIDPGADDETAADESSTTGSAMCPAGTLDCDGAPGCEADADDPTSCGSCGNVCELAGQPLECVAGECTGTVVLTDLADTYVDAAQPNQNFGTEPSLIVGDGLRAFIALPDIEALPNTATLEHVELHLTCTQVGTPLELQRVETEWDEQQMTASTAPSNSEVIGSFEFTLGENVIELAGMLPSWRSGTPKRSIELAATGPDPMPVEFSSREGASAPYLVVTLSW